MFSPASAQLNLYQRKQHPVLSYSYSRSSAFFDNLEISNSSGEETPVAEEPAPLQPTIPDLDGKELPVLPTVAGDSPQLPIDIEVEQ